ncbi:hypothetical protein L227DRAFT_277398 [Lentinus tigrinus ALCF2SS1-6]|uniref:Uncharacterized protein n=1 Tax=Lentinus tigrinus ALCF2SS1-6 TaxID=1328759 RepID=A0A5C2SP29_9APHY|nr:hypothetical protein L227DRAFT_277398 [Lentinus tigrinus ALCF2SS1-6]
MCFRPTSPAHQFTDLVPPASASPPSASAASQHHLRIVCPNVENALRSRSGSILGPWPCFPDWLMLAPISLCRARPPDHRNCARHGVNIGLGFRVVFPAAAHISPNRAVLPGCRATYGMLAVHAAWFPNALRSALADALSQRSNLRCSAIIVRAPVRTLRTGAATRRRGSRTSSRIARTYSTRTTTSVQVPSHQNSHREMRCGCRAFFNTVVR